MKAARVAKDSVLRRALSSKLGASSLTRLGPLRIMNCTPALKLLARRGGKLGVVSAR